MCSFKVVVHECRIGATRSLFCFRPSALYCVCLLAFLGRLGRRRLNCLRDLLRLCLSYLVGLYDARCLCLYGIVACGCGSLCYYIALQRPTVWLTPWQFEHLGGFHFLLNTCVLARIRPSCFIFSTPSLMEVLSSTNWNIGRDLFVAQETI